eukprot:16298180-Heterocapsa_arctica.AAC.1
MTLKLDGKHNKKTVAKAQHMAIEIVHSEHLNNMTRLMNEEEANIYITCLKTEKDKPKATCEDLEQYLRQAQQRHEAAGRSSEGTVNAAASLC